MEDEILAELPKWIKNNFRKISKKKNWKKLLTIEKTRKIRDEFPVPFTTQRVRKKAGGHDWRRGWLGGRTYPYQIQKSKPQFLPVREIGRCVFLFFFSKSWKYFDQIIMWFFIITLTNCSKNSPDWSNSNAEKPLLDVGL